MVTKKDVMDMYAHLRTTNSNISDEALDFMKEVCLAKISKDTETYICTDFDIKLNDIKQLQRKIKQEPNGSIFTIQISKR